MGILLVVAKSPCVCEREGEWRRTECMCDKDTSSVCEIGISLNEAIVCVCMIERACLKKGRKSYIDTMSGRETCMQWWKHECAGV